MNHSGSLYWDDVAQVVPIQVNHRPAELEAKNSR
jgi:hypothetical protein